MNLRALTFSLLLSLAYPISALQPLQRSIGDHQTDSLSADTVVEQSAQQPRKLSLIRRIIRGFDRLDENYIEPQHYVYQTMLQTTYSYDLFELSSSDANEQKISFSPDGSFKVGPYIGWKWVFLGYTFSLNHSDFRKNKTELGMSIYSSQIGIDLLYRRTGSDYKIREADLGSGIDTGPLENTSFDGVKAGITGINAYYIFNHGRFSYPAAFAQSTRQKISCGSWMAGLGYTKNTLELDHELLKSVVSERLASQTVTLDSGLMFRSVEYHDFSISGGYAYNWVFAPKWLFCASCQVALGYKKTTGISMSSVSEYSKVSVSPNLIGRFAVVYNNSDWFAGFSAIVHSNNYRQARFMTKNTFGSFNMYVGYNFGMKKKYRKSSSQAKRR